MEKTNQPCHVHDQGWADQVHLQYVQFYTQSKLSLASNQTERLSSLCTQATVAKTACSAGNYVLSPGPTLLPIIILA